MLALSVLVQFSSVYAFHFFNAASFLRISAARNSQKGSYKDKRDLVTYEEELF